MSHSTDPASASGPPALAIAGLLVALFLSAIDATIVGTAMPAVARAIGGMELYAWSFSAFMLAATVVMPFYGKLADVWGTRRCLFVAIALLLVGSAACGAAPSMPWLIAGRVVQGLGSGGLTTLVFVAFGQLFAPEVRGRAQGLVSLVWGVSTLLGPLAGGLMVTYLPWPWVFWINLPAGLLAGLFIFAAYPAPTEPPRPHRISLLDGALLAGGLSSALVALSAPGLATAVGGLVGLAALAWFLRRPADAAEPLIPLGLFRRRTYALSVTLGFASCVTMFAALTYVPLLIQAVWGRTAPEAGAAVTPMMFAWPAGGALAGALVNRLGFRALVVVGTSFMAIGYGLLAWPGGAPVLAVVSAEAALLGCGMGFVTATSLVAAQTSVPRREVGAASSTLALMRNLGAAVGVAVLGGVQWIAYGRFLAGPPALPEREALAASLQLVFAVSLVVASLTVALAACLPAHAPAEAAREAEGA